MALKFSYFDPDKNVSAPNFAANLLQTGMLTILQSRLDMHIMRGDDPLSRRKTIHTRRQAPRAK